MGIPPPVTASQGTQHGDPPHQGKCPTSQHGDPPTRENVRHPSMGIPPPVTASQGIDWFLQKSECACPGGLAL